MLFTAYNKCKTELENKLKIKLPRRIKIPCQAPGLGTDRIRTLVRTAHQRGFSCLCGVSPHIGLTSSSMVASGKLDLLHVLRAPGIMFQKIIQKPQSHLWLSF